MDQTRAAERALAIEARVRVDDLRRGNLETESRSRLEVAARRVERQFPTFDPLLPADIAALEHDDVRLRGVDVLMIDPIQALATGGHALDEEMASAARALKRLAVERDVCVITTSGLPQIVRDRKDPRPQL